MFGRIFSREGFSLEKEWGFSVRRLRDDIAFHFFRLNGTCSSLQDDARSQASMDSVISSTLSYDDLLRSRRQ